MCSATITHSCFLYLKNAHSLYFWTPSYKLPSYILHIKMRRKVASKEVRQTCSNVRPQVAMDTNNMRIKHIGFLHNIRSSMTDVSLSPNPLTPLVEYRYLYGTYYIRLQAAL